MKTVFKFIAGFIVVSPLLLSQAAVAIEREGLFVEPTLTYEPGDTKVNYPAPITNSTGTAKGFGVGARVGAHANEALFLGLDGRYSMPVFNDSSVNYNSTAKAANLGAIVGVQMPEYGMRVWGTYVFTGILDPEESRNLDVRFEDAKGYRVGAGFRLMNFSANLEYQQLEYGKSKLQRAGPFAPGTTFGNVNLTNNTWIAGISFPLEL